jgi:hypothetical protein
MKKRLGLMVCGTFPDVRVGRITEAMNDNGWEHDVICRRPPVQLDYAYRHIRSCAYWDWPDFVREIRNSKAEVIHVHGELYDYWPVLAAKEAGDDRPVILNCHDLVCARQESLFDVYEADALANADAHVWVTDEQRDFASKLGLVTDKPTAVISNFPSSSVFVDKPLFPHIGGILYEGGIDKRGDDSNRRDFSAVADALDGNLHILPANTFVGDETYGIVHDLEYDYSLVCQRIAQYDWGFAGHAEPNPAWGHSFPTKVGEYWAAGLPFVSINVPLLQQYADKGMGIVIDSLSQLKRLPDPKPYRKAVLNLRGQYTVQREIPALAKMYGGLT